MAKVESAYIHIPFCKQMCYYCNFVKYYYTDKRATEYLHALEKEIDGYLPGDKNTLRTIYIGGGTPTALNSDQLKQLFQFLYKKFDVAKIEELTIEINPGDVDGEKLKILKDAGVNRISFGVQVMDDTMLKELGRTHKVEDVYRTVEMLKENRFSNVSLDLIYALPKQTVERFEKSLQDALAFQLPHYSTYALQIEPNTVFYKRHKKGLLQRPKEDDEVEMYTILRETMRKNGVAQYEISNFAKPGYESKHNLTYWNNEYYYGFGAGASGYLPGSRYTNVKPLSLYIEKAMSQEKPILETDVIGLKERIEEEMFLGLRKIQGYNGEVFNRKFGFRLESVYGNQLKALQSKGLLTEQRGIWRLTERGMLLENRVFTEFILNDSDEDMLNKLKG